jgi:pyruvate/2-oxoglutarate dehydrogenase complex dihydrolipoamide acyltransferase (E2) component
MIYKLVVPPAVEGVEEFRILQWHKAEGDAIASDQLVVELETDKAIIEVRSARACVLRKIALSPGEWTRLGPPIAWFTDTAGEALEFDGAGDFAPHWEIT